jgi:hypothetical protein
MGWDDNSAACTKQACDVCGRVRFMILPTCRSCREWAEKVLAVLDRQARSLFEGVTERDFYR